MNDDRDPILEAGLDEMLGGCKPPDLTDRILRALEQRQCELGSPIASHSHASDEGRRRRKSDRVGATRKWKVSAATGLVLALSVVAMLMVFAFSRWRHNGPSLVHEPVSTKQRKSDDQEKNPRKSQPDRPIEPADQQLANTSASENSTSPNSVEQPKDAVPPIQVDTGTTNETPAVASVKTRQENVVPSSRVQPAFRADDEVIEKINSMLAANWAKHNVSPAPRISHVQWCERAFRIIVGRDPKPSETATYLKDPPARRRSKLLAKLLHGDEYVEEFARRWSEFWTAQLLDADTLADARTANREGLLQYFRRAMIDKRPFDQVAEELLTATGAGVPGSEDYDGAANFLLARSEEKFVRATADVSRLFLGRNIECQQCHHDPHFDGGKQNQFWELNAFFRQLAVRRDDGTNLARLMDVDFPGDDGQVEDAKVFYVVPNGLLKVAYPVFNGESIAASGRLAEVNRRRLLARFVTSSVDFPRNVANRVWAAVMGRGFAAFDQVARNNVLSHPDTLVELGDQFVAHGYDMRKVIYWAALSDPFQLASETDSAGLASIESEMPLFNRFYEPNPPAVLKVHQALLAVAKDFASEPRDLTTTAKVESLPNSFKKNGEIKLTPVAPSDALLNQSGTSSDPMLRAVLGNSRLRAKQKAEHLFQMTLHRQPRAREVAVVEEILTKAGENPDIALKAIWSALHSVEASN